MPKPRAAPPRILAALLVALAAAAPTIAAAAPVYKDAERFEAGGGDVSRGSPRLRGGEPGSSRPSRRITPGPGYVGSEWGLGKPNYWGIAPRPDRGYWDE